MLFNLWVGFRHTDSVPAYNVDALGRAFVEKTWVLERQKQ